MSQDAVSDSPLDRRIDYVQGALDEASILGQPPHVLLAQWLSEADQAGAPEPQAMTLATVDPDGFPSARVVLLRRLSPEGLAFFTNYNSRKAAALAANPRASLLFYWQTLERQVRVEGLVEKLPEADSDAYYAGRPVKSRQGAWASPQSQPIPDRAWLESALEQVISMQGDSPDRPPFWGGYRLIPSRYEFWQGRRSRLHDRLVLTLSDSAADRSVPESWALSRLAP